MSIKSILLVSLFFFLSFWQLHAQEYTIDVQKINIEDGLLHRKVIDIQEDQNGIMWLTSDQGLQRYDGYEFKSWLKNDLLHLSLPVQMVCIDHAGWLWLLDEKSNLIFLHTETEEILTVEERFGDDFPLAIKTDANEEQKNQEPWNFQRFKKNSKGQDVTTTLDGQLVTFDKENGFQFVALENKINGSILVLDEEDNMWMVHSKEGIIFHYNSKGKLLHSYREKEGENSDSFFNRNGSLYFFSVKEFYSITKKPKITRVLKEMDASGNIKTVDWHISKGNMINGFFWSKTKIGRELYYPFEKTPVYTLKRSDYDISLFESSNPYADSKGRIWFYGDLGLNKVEIRPAKFKKHLSFKTENDKPINNTVRGIHVDQDTIFTNLEMSAFVRLDKNDSNNWAILNEEGNPRALRKNEDGTFWVGSNFFLQKINPNGEVIQKIDTETKLHHGIWSFFEDKQEKLWMASIKKLYFKDKNENEVRLFQPTEDPTNFSKRNVAIQNMIPAKDDKVWFCTLDGLYLFDPIEEKVLERYASDETGKNYLPADKFYYLHEEEDGIIWLGTGNGLIKWKGRTQESQEFDYQLFTRKDGLSNNVIYAIFEDEQNRLWMSSDYGIMSFDKATFNVKSYLEKDGITHHEFNRTAQFQAEDGRIYFGGLNGITSFHPNDFIQDKKDQAKMLISSFDIFDGEKEVLIDRVGELRVTRTIDFYPSDRFFRLKFVLPTFEDIDKILYAWKMEGVDADWNYQKENTLQFGALPYGTHTLRIKGQSSTGVWSPHELAIKVNVYKPFYFQTWFLLLGILSVVTGAFLFYKRRTSQFLKQQEILKTEVQKATHQIATDKKTIELQAEELHELDKLKSRFFANVSHELRTPLTLMLGPISSAIKNGDLSNRDFTLLKTAQQNGKDLLKLIAAILDLSKMESGKMELEETPELLFSLVRRIASNFESHAQRGGVQFSFNYEAEQDLQIELDKGKLEIILNNLLSNAVKFTPSGGKISVLVEDLKNKIKIKVTDSGRGIHPDDLPHVFDRFYQSKQPNAPTEGGTGIGLALSQEFVKMMDGKIWVKSELGKGATFAFEIHRKEVLGMVETEKILEVEKINQELEQVEIPIFKNAVAEKNGRPTILVVEDNYSLREYLQTILSNKFEVLSAENGAVALNILSQNKKEETNQPQLIISDIMMPVMDGFQLLTSVKGSKDFSHLPMVMLTARADIQDKLKALRIGVDDYLLKPFEEKELIVRVENLLKNYQERKSAAIILSSENKESKEVSETPIISREDQKWLEELEKTLLQQLSNSQYSISQLAHDMAISERQLRRRIKQLIGLTPAQYFKDIRLHQARRLLENKKYKTVAQTASAVGFQDVGGFSRNFFIHFGKNPSEYMKG